MGWLSLGGAIYRAPTVLIKPVNLYSDFCVNRQPRAAYRCNMDTKVGFLKPRNQVLCAKTNGNFYFCQRAYCFRLGTSCYIWHDPVTGSILEDYFPKFVVQTLSFRNSSQDSPAGHCELPRQFHMVQVLLLFQQPAYGGLHII